jgi:hypothetical protein
MIKKKVVIKYKDGHIFKGWIEEFKPGRESFILFPLIEYSSEKRMVVNIESLKAVFFVKDFMGNKDYKKAKTFNVNVNVTPTQRKIIVEFTDNEKLYGTCLTYGRYKKGFFVFPIDPKDNNKRIFVVHSSTKKVNLLKIEI